MIKACIFDLDGTIINTEESLTQSVNETLGTLGYPGIDVTQTRAFIGCGGRKFVERALSVYVKPDDELIDKAFSKYKEIFAERCTYNNKAYEGMEETLSELKSQGIKLGVISNKSQEGVESCIHKVYGDTLFDYIAGEKKGVPLKPDPAGIINAVKALEVKPEECLYIGDGDTDMIGGKAAGCITVAVTWGFRTREFLEKYNPDYIIDRPEDLYIIAG